MNHSSSSLAAEDSTEESAVERAVGPCLANGRMEQLLAGQLAGVELVWAERHLECCPACNQRLLNLAGPIPTDRTILTAGETAPNARTLGILDKIAEASPFPVSLIRGTGGAAPHSPPAELAGFVDVSFVGRGGSGSVYRARQESLGRWVALKVLLVETASGSASQAQREAQALASLNHPHVVTVHEAHLLQTPPFLVMEWVSGGSLQERLQTGPLSIADTIRLASQMAEAVAAVHALGLVHRDLKPANVLLMGPSAGDASPAPASHSLIAKITDFGLALTVQSGIRTTLEGRAVGTPAYMAPEQTGLRLGLGPVGPACDIYGIGAVIFAALTGRPPHEEDHPMATLAHVAWEEIPGVRGLRSDVPVDLATIVAKCLRPLPAERYRSVIELKNDLERYQRGEPIIARNYTPRERIRNWIRRHPTVTVALGLGGTMLLASVLGATYHLTQLRRNLAELQVQQQRVAAALLSAERATKAEKRLRSETVRQVAIANPVMLRSLQHPKAITHDNLELLERIRRFYHAQIQTPTPLETELAEILGEGLTALCVIESWDLEKPRLAEEDSERLLRLAAEHPGSSSLLMNRTQVLNVRWGMFHRQDRAAEAEAALEEITSIAEQCANDPSAAMPPDFQQSLIAMLWNAEDWPRALLVVDRGLQREHLRFAKDVRPIESWWNLLALQAQRVGLMHQMRRWADAEEVLQKWLELAQQVPSPDATMRRNLVIHRLRLIGQHLQHAAPHWTVHQRERLLHEGRELFTALGLPTVALRDEALALIEWATTLEGLPGGLVPAEELDSNWEAIQRVISLVPSREIRHTFLPPLINLRIRQARRLLTEGQVATALQMCRDCLDDLQIPNPRAAVLDDRLLVEVLDVAAQASHQMGGAAEELSYLSRAADLAAGGEKTRFQQRLAQALHGQGIALPVEGPSSDR